MNTNLYVIFDVLTPSADLSYLASRISIPGYSFTTKTQKQTIRVPRNGNFPVYCFFYAQNYFRIYISTSAVEFYREAVIPAELLAGETKLFKTILETNEFSVLRWLATSEDWDDDDQPFVNTISEGTSAESFPLMQN